MAFPSIAILMQIEVEPFLPYKSIFTTKKKTKQNKTKHKKKKNFSSKKMEEKEDIYSQLLTAVGLRVIKLLSSLHHLKEVIT